MDKTNVYGPVPSRRLGRSLGVDMVPYKVCTFDCIYCQLGRTTSTTYKRLPYVKADAILADIARCLESGVTADYITLAGSGEPTLNSGIGEVIDGIRSISDIPVVVLTNGSLLGIPEVTKALLHADVVAPSLDACDEIMFSRINRPDPAISYDSLLSGLASFRKSFPGRIWLEIFLVAGINDTPDAMREFARVIQPICPDKIHVNTAVRPPAYPDTKRVENSRLAELAAMLGDKAEVISDFKANGTPDNSGEDVTTGILNLLARRPCTLADMSGGLKRHPAEILKYLDPLVKAGRVTTITTDNKTYYQKNVKI